MRRSLRLGLLSAVFVSILGNLVGIGCSATGSDIGGLDAVDSGPDTGKAPAATTDASGTTDSGNVKDAGPSADAGADAAIDAGPISYAPGDPCPVVNKVYSRACGKCGTQSALCQASSDAGTLPDGGAGGVLGAYGACTNQTGACVPGNSQTCGNCGQQTCSNSCKWSTCTGQGQCAAGSVEYSTASCTTPNTFIEHTCSGSCTWGPFTTTCTSPSLTVPAAVDAVNSGNFTLSPNLIMKHVDIWGNQCPATNLATASPYFAVPVTNNTGKAAVVQIYNSGPKPLDTVMAIYTGATVPEDDAALLNCSKLADNCTALSDICGNLTTGGFSWDWAGIDDVSIPAGGSVMVITSGMSATTTGAFSLNVKTKSLN